MSTLIALLLALAATGGLFTLAGLNDLPAWLLPAAWLADLATFFMPYVAGSLALLFMLPTLTVKRLLVLLLIGAAGAGGLVWTRLSPAEATARGDVRIATFNVLFNNKDYAGVRRWAAESDADVIVLQEAAYGWPAQIAGWGEWPVRLAGRGSSVAILSRLPLSTRDPKAQAILRPEVRRAVVQRPDGAGDLVVLGIHPETPRSLAQWQNRNRALNAIAGMVRAETPGIPLVVAGDWNTPTWSPYFAGFLERTGLYDGGEGLLPPPTRISRREGVPAFVGSPVDRIVLSRDLVATRRIVGPQLGSDHLPVVVDLSLPPPSPKTAQPGST